VDVGLDETLEELAWLFGMPIQTTSMEHQGYQTSHGEFSSRRDTPEFSDPAH
jgi:hypothetical protein